MDRSVAPIGLAIALRGSGLRLAGPLGAGSGGPRWSATDDDGARWVLTVVPARGADRARRRAAALAGLDHPHLTRLGTVVDLPDGAVVLAHAAVPGIDLVTLAAARGALRPGEVVGLLVPVAHALAALHRAGLSHGDVSPANVVVADGRAVLVDLVHGGDAGEHGTAGFAAPERLDAAGPAGDVHALARVGLALLGPAEPARGPAAARAHDGVAATGVTAPGDAADVEAALRAVLGRAVHDDPGRRGTAQGLAAAMVAVCTPEAADLPDPAVLARLALRRLAGPGGEGARAGVGRGAATPDGVTTRRRAARGRHRRRRAGWVGGWAAGSVVAVVGVALAGAAAAGVLQPAGATTGPVGPLAAATRLTVARTAALATLDRPALAGVTLPGSPAASADRELLAALVRGGRVPAVEQLAVLVRPGAGPHRVVTGSWMLTAEGARYSQVELVLGSTPAGWRVAEVRPSAP